MPFHEAPEDGRAAHVPELPERLHVGVAQLACVAAIAVAVVEVPAPAPWCPVMAYLAAAAASEWAAALVRHLFHTAKNKGRASRNHDPVWLRLVRAPGGVQRPAERRWPSAAALRCGGCFVELRDVSRELRSAFSDLGVRFGCFRGQTFDLFLRER